MNDNVRHINRLVNALSPGGEPPDNGSMEARMAKLEELVKGLPTKSDFSELRSELRADYAVMRADTAKSQADMHKAIADNHRWTHAALVGFATLALAGIVGVMIAIWNIGKPTAPAAQQAPYVIMVPQPAAQAPTTPTPKP